jgi:CRISPR/Cas system CMR subunit Cmr6 (Cas7 group RAMP superfamily)
MAKGVPWNKIKVDYLNGITPKELAEKYKLTAKQIHDKANRDSWVKEKTSIAEKTRENVQERIKELTNLALETLCEVINDPETSSRDKVSASKAILDVSGLKTLKQEVSGVGGYSVIINREAVEVECNKL